MDPEITQITSYRVIGEVKNTGSTNIGYVDIVVDFHDADGNKIANKVGNNLISPILPGRKSPFSVTLDNSPDTARQVANFHVSLGQVTETDQNPPQKLQIVDSWIETETSNAGFVYKYVKGHILNFGDAQAQDVWVYATFYNGGGQVTYLNGAQIHGFSLSAHGIDTFDIQIVAHNPYDPTTNDYVEMMASYEVTATSSTYVMVPEFRLVFLTLSIATIVMLVFLRKKHVGRTTR
jgi:hypothetical protein